MADTLESLEIQVKHSATGAADEINKVAASVKVLGQYLSTVVPKLKEFSSALNGNAFTINDQSTNQYADTINNVKQAANGAKKATTEASKGINAMAKAAQKSKTPLDNFIASLKRIAFYRIIRGIIKAITQALQEGLQAAYQFSTGMTGEGARFAAAMDNIKAHSNAMKGQLGSAFIALLAAVEPILNRLIALVTAAADAIAQLFSAFSGKGQTYLKATVDSSAKFADNAKKAGGAAKEWKNQLLGFDEINRLNEPSKGGGGGGTNTPKGYGMEESPINAFIQSLANAIKAGAWDVVGKLISGKIKEVLHKAAEWLRDFDFGEFARNIFGGIRDFLNGFDIGGVMASLSEFIAEVINSIADFINGATDTGLIDAIGNFISRAVAGIDKEKIFEALLNLLTVIITNIPVLFLRLLGLLTAVVGEIIATLVGFCNKAGEESVRGFFNGIVDALKNAAQWLKDNLVNPIVEAVKDALGIHSPSTVFADIGKDVIEGLWKGIEEKWNSFKSWMNGVWNDFKTWWEGRSVSPWHITLPHLVVDWEGLPADSILGQLFGFPAIPHFRINWYANGGFPSQGQLFFASENGAEMVGSMDGRTAVANNDQIVEGIRQGVYDAVMAANNNGGNGTSFKLYLDSREIKYGLQQVDRAWG